jgi:two-component system, LytTR family, response regulator LytT
MNASSKLRILILEDEWAARDYLRELIEQTGHAIVIDSVQDIESANSVLRNANDERIVDVVFVDIQLAGSAGDGLTFVRSWSKGAEGPRMVLATASKEHALEAYGLGVHDYVLKPFTLARIQECISRLFAHHRAKDTPLTSRRLAVRDGRALVFVEVEQAWAFEAADRLTVLHTEQGRFDIDLSLASVETELGSGMLRVHRNWLVNTSLIQGVVREEGEMNLLVGKPLDQAKALRVPVSKDRSHSLRNELLQGTIGIRKR